MVAQTLLSMAGSVNPANAREFLERPEIGGGWSVAPVSERMIFLQILTIIPTYEDPRTRAVISAARRSSFAPILTLPVGSDGVIQEEFRIIRQRENLQKPCLAARGCSWGPYLGGSPLRELVPQLQVCWGLRGISVVISDADKSSDGSRYAGTAGKPADPIPARKTKNEAFAGSLVRRLRLVVTMRSRSVTANTLRWRPRPSSCLHTAGLLWWRNPHDAGQSWMPSCRSKWCTSAEPKPARKYRSSNIHDKAERVVVGGHRRQ